MNMSRGEERRHEASCSKNNGTDARAHRVTIASLVIKTTDYQLLMFALPPLSPKGSPPDFDV